MCVSPFFTAFDMQERLREREREASEDGGSTTSRRRKDPRDAHDDDREKERDRARSKDRDHRDREKDRDEKDSHHERESRSSRRHHKHDDYDKEVRRPSRDYSRDRGYSKDRGHYKDKERDHDREYYKSSRHHRDYERDDRRRRGSSRAEFDGYSRDWDEPYPAETLPYHERERSASVYKEERDPREKRERPAYDDRLYEERAEKVCTSSSIQVTYADSNHSVPATTLPKHLHPNPRSRKSPLLGQRLQRKERFSSAVRCLAVAYMHPYSIACVAKEQ